MHNPDKAMRAAVAHGRPSNWPEAPFARAIPWRPFAVLSARWKCRVLLMRLCIKLSPFHP